ncbi:RagB/SusD family nutrient uptake outer membrane protein [Gaoshiqia sediminis]|uniref:RagB/SusD family nutrient uptake outer membrane protein n=1 Tax=Gaoshiqia sediminis TaxID=2986998 RepID=A0AA41Y191_9BACT|nr:RagB/SusD family nutrient uptake outer membrane protein [Gaoshiqia sediminis]MCW0481604.1 RagB/SusD family nutrient uptake outer membrane protein [Gaoshiqia sediminis]
MKKYIVIRKIRNSVFAFLVIMGVSCTELKDESWNTIIASQFSATDQDLAALAGSAYVNWRAVLMQWNGLYRANEVSGDQMLTPARPNGWVDGGVYRRIHEHKWTTDDDIVVNTWSRTYAGITNCNRVIYQVESGTIPVPESDKIALIAEMKLLRASYYWVLCDFFGNVPIVDQFDVPEGYLPEQNTRKQVYDFIVSEIIENIPLVSAENNQKTYGKFNQWAGYALLAKMYLNAEVYTGTAEWTKCIQACDAIINSDAGYELDANQRDVFITNNENAKEIIFALPFESKYVTEWNAFDIHMQTLQPENQATYNLQYSPWGGVCAVPQFISTFDTDDARYRDNYIKGQQYTATGDVIYATLGAYKGEPLAYINEVPGVDYSEEVHGFRLGKFEIEMGATNRLSNDFPLFRYADILMMKAECLLRLGDEDAAADLVTTVRERNFKLNPEKAEVTGAELLAGSSYDYGLRNHISSTDEGGSDIEYGRFLDELGWEFCQEGRRRTDMIRFGVFTKKSWLSHSPNGDYRVLFPIPIGEIQKNSNLAQNPGY